MRKARSEAHIVDFPGGHNMSLDCWCEPAKMYWITDDHNQKVFIIEHQDDCPVHHKTILAERDAVQDWITKILNKIKIDGLAN